MKWPGKDLVLTDGLIEEWAKSVELLLDLQEPYVVLTQSPTIFLQEVKRLICA